MNKVPPIKGKAEEFGDSEFRTVLPGAESTGVHYRIRSFPSFVSVFVYFLGLGRVALS